MRRRLHRGSERPSYADALLAVGDGDRCVELAEHARSEMQHTAFEYGVAYVQRALARAAHRRGETAARAMMADAAATFAGIDATLDEAVTREELARLCRDAGDTAEAASQCDSPDSRTGAAAAAAGTEVRPGPLNTWDRFSGEKKWG